MVRFLRKAIEKLLRFHVISYLFVGASAAFTDVGVFSLLSVWLGLEIFSASVVSFLFAVTVNYYLGLWITFDSGVRFRGSHEFALVLCVSLLGLGINVLCTSLFAHLIGLSAVVSKIFAIFPTFLWNYCLRRHFVFKEGGESRVG